jgi:MFS family permease
VQCGRLLIGRVSDSVQRSKLLIIIAASMTASMSVFIANNIAAIYVGVLLTGITYGCVFSLLPSMINQYFGNRYFGSMWGFIGLAPALGSELMSAELAGSMIERFGKTSYVTIVFPTSTTMACLGRACFAYTFIACTALSFLAVVASIALHWHRTRPDSARKPLLE